MLALAAIVVASAQQAPAVAWQHTLIRHERFEDFESGSGTGSCVRMDAYGPLWLVPQPRAKDHIGTWFEEGECELARFESGVLEIPSGFEELVLSWNLAVPSDVDFTLDVRVADEDSSAWSTWLEVMHSGVAIPEVRPAQVVPSSEDLLEFSDEPVRQEFDGGRIEFARFTSRHVWHRAQYRVRARYGHKAPGDAIVRVRRVVLVASRRVDRAEVALAPVNAAAVRRITVPRWSIGDLEPEVRQSWGFSASLDAAVRYRGEGRLGMLEPFRGMPWSQLEVMLASAVQAAYRSRIPGYIARYSAWSDVEALIADRQPLVIRVEGEDPTEPDHDRWMVLSGFDERGDVCVEDPLAPELKTLPRERLTRDWLARGGTALVFLPREK